MAWIDDRIWCHPKFTGLTDAQFAAYVKGVAYSSGMGTRGLLTSDQQRLMFVHPRTRRALTDAGLWDAVGSAGDVHIHDWDEHNGKRDERRAKDRERKRQQRKHPQDSPQDVGKTSAWTSAGASTGTAHVDRVTSDRVTTTAEGDAAIERLKNAGWSDNQVGQAVAILDLKRAVAWLDHAEADPSCQSVGALSWSMFKKGGRPEQAVTIANGAQGTRSVIPKPKFVCDCGVGFNSEPAYEDHLENVHGVVRA